MEIPHRSGVEWFGDPLANGSFIVSFADSRPSDIYRELALAFALKNGYELTPALLQTIDRTARARDAEYFGEARARGISKSIRDLLGARRKKDAERIASEVVIDAAQFHDLVLNCQMLGLSHHSKFHSFEPEQRLLTADERAALFASGETQPPSADQEKVAAKVRQLFVEREQRSIHMFANSRDEWHCFFFSFDDIADSGNHWTGGSHVHYVSHVFDPRKLTKKKVWKALDQCRHGFGVGRKLAVLVALRRLRTHQPMRIFEQC